jgi:hypothetical protein
MYPSIRPFRVLFLASSVSQPFTAPPTHFNQPPTASWVIPDLLHDMHMLSASASKLL